MKRSKLNRWLQDLRSGAFTQARDILMRSDCKNGCCLGVYLLNNGPAPLEDFAEYNHHEWCLNWSDPLFSAPEHTIYTVLPERVTIEDKWYGDSGSCIGGDGFAENKFKTSLGEFGSLAGANDAGVPFTEIADIVEAHPLWFFKSIEEDIEDENQLEAPSLQDQPE